MGRKKAKAEGERDNLGVTVTRKEDFSKWYTEVVRKGCFKDQRTPVKGFDVIQPWGYALWERVQGAYDRLLKEKGVQNCYFPLLIPESFIEKEREHFEGFEAETANVTEVGSEPLNEKLIIRPTSETIAYHMFTKWIRSHRDLPLRINQWCNVVRWDTKVTKPFIRDREFLWSEVHTAHASLEDGLQQIDDYIEINDRFHEDLAMAALVLRRTDKDKFPGAEFSVAYDTLVQDGKVFQGPGGHFLGQNFSKPFGIRFTHEDGKKEHVWQTCLGMSTRQIGGIIMQHGDDKGAILPPAIAPVQAVIVPIIFKGKEKAVMDKAHEVALRLMKMGVCTKLDDRDYSAGYKFNDWEIRGVPLRIEIGPRDVASNALTVVKRNDRRKISIKASQLGNVKDILDTIQKEMLEESKRNLKKNTRSVKTMKNLKGSVDKGGFSKANWCGSEGCEDTIKDETGASIRGSIYGKSERTFGDCVCCGKKAVSVVYIAKAY